VKHAQIQQLRSDVNQERTALFQALQDVRSQEYVATKQQSLVAELKMKELRESELQRRKH
jgi:predicted Holliday junction resolvase-like endonuclease